MGQGRLRQAQLAPSEAATVAMVAGSAAAGWRQLVQRRLGSGDARPNTVSTAAQRRGRDTARSSNICLATIPKIRYTRAFQ